MVAALVVVWQVLASSHHLNPLLIPAPATLVRDFVDRPTTFITPLLRTVSTAVIGLVVGVSAAYVAASLGWLLPLLGTFITPVSLIIRSVPFVALIPVITRSLGYSETTAWIVCSLVTFFPTFVLVTTGLRKVPAHGGELFDVAGASRWDRYRLLAMPASLPSLATSLRIAAATSVAAALVAEFLMGTPGLALVLTNSLDSLDIATLWTASACATAVAIAAYLAAGRLEAHVVERCQ